MNPLWDAAQALLALIQECLNDHCHDYKRVMVDTTPPVFDCASISVVIGGAKAYSSSCIGRNQLNSNLDIWVVRCCEPVGDLSNISGYTPPTPEEIEASAACLVRDVWAIYNCINCEACDTIGVIPGVDACCNENAGAPEIIWGNPSGGCRSAIIRIPIVFTICC